MIILGFDISSATIGWSLINIDNDTFHLLDWGHIKPPSKKESNDNISLRLDFAFSELTKLISNLKFTPDYVAVEDYAKKFSKNKSSANTLILLAAFNEVCCLSLYRSLNIKPEKISVSRIRSLISKHFKINLKEKEDVLQFCKNIFKNFLIVNNRAGNIKKECYDEADSIAVAIGYYLEIKDKK